MFPPISNQHAVWRLCTTAHPPIYLLPLESFKAPVVWWLQRRSIDRRCKLVASQGAGSVEDGFSLNVSVHCVFVSFVFLSF